MAARPSAAVTPDVWLDGIVSTFEEALRALPKEGEWLRLSLPGPSFAQAMAAMASLSSTGPACFWRSREGEYLLSAGEACVLEASGESRFASIRQAAAQVEARIEARTLAGAEPRPPRFLGGFAFESALRPDPRWASWAPARFALPRWTYEIDAEGQSTLSLSIAREELERGERARAIEEVRTWFKATPQGSEALAMHRLHASPRESELAAWSALVEGAQGALQPGRLEKVVLARRSEISLSSSVDPSLLWRRAVERFPSCTQFVFRSRHSSFVGASPERLVRKQGATLWTEALAGSAAVGEAEGLQRSEKNRYEHELVRAYVVDRLRSRGLRVHFAAAPRLWVLPNVAHLHTPIRSEVAPEAHVLEWVELLHPTPALCGLPVDEARAWLRAHEGLERGWYGGPVGWFDGAGNGEFAVALRCALLEASRATLYAGAGIVAASRAADEYVETEMKMAAMAALFEAEARPTLKGESAKLRRASDAEGWDANALHPHD